MNPWRDSWEFISRHFLSVYGICLLYVLPVQLFYLLSTTMFPLFLTAKMVAIHKWILFLVCLIISQVPFILLVRQVEETGEISVSQLLRTLLDRFWGLSFRFLLFMVPIYWGLYLYIIPGMLLFVLLLLLPFPVLWERGDWKQSLKMAWDLGFQHLGKLIMFFAILVGVLNLLESGSSFLIQLYADGQPITLLIPSLLGSFVFPVYTVYVSYRYLEWREGYKYYLGEG